MDFFVFFTENSDRTRESNMDNNMGWNMNMNRKVDQNRNQTTNGINIKDYLKKAAVLMIMAAMIMTLVPARGAYVAAASASAQKSASQKKDTYNYKLKTKSKVAARKKASARSKKILTIKKGKTVYADKLVGKKWYRFKYKNRYLYILKKRTRLDRTIVMYAVKMKMQAKEKIIVRSSYSTSSKQLGKIAAGDTFKVKGLYTIRKGGKWYRITFNKKKAFIPAASAQRYVKPVLSEDDQYRQQLSEAGFPDSYREQLLALHKKHPNWIFKAVRTGYSWDVLNKTARVTGRNLIDSTVTKKWRSKSKKVYDVSTKTWKTFDGGRWYQAKNSVIAYYLDPRNFLTEDSIYQFMTHKFGTAGQSKKSVKRIAGYVSFSFLNTQEYVDTIYEAGKAGKVNPNVLTAMIIEEQGWHGSSGLISGMTKGYKGYYNFFNIGAYTANGMTAVQRGLWYAKGEDKGLTTYARPWDSKYKAILGGAMFYSEKYVTKNQYNYYSKKFNVFNGADKLGTHEYMTNVMGAEEEGRIVKRAYKFNNNSKIRFYIPVYEQMPLAPCPRPAE